jgi:hypothetical protein
MNAVRNITQQADTIAWLPLCGMFTVAATVRLVISSSRIEGEYHKARGRQIQI